MPLEFEDYSELMHVNFTLLLPSGCSKMAAAVMRLKEENRPRPRNRKQI